MVQTELIKSHPDYYSYKNLSAHTLRIDDDGVTCLDCNSELKDLSDGDLILIICPNCTNGVRVTGTRITKDEHDELINR